MIDTSDFRDPITKKVDWEAYDKAYKAEQLKELERQGFRPNLTDDQVYAITEPTEAPENYACDGEISRAEAKKRWLNNLVKVGLTPKEVKLARKLNGI